MDAVTLYHGLASTCSKKVRLSLYEKGVPFASRLMDLQKFEQHDPGYLAINPKGVVPTLVHGDEIVVESSWIIQYVDAAFDGPRLTPADPAGHAAVQRWLRFSDDIAYAAVFAPTWQHMRHRAEKHLTGDALATTLSRVPTLERRERWTDMAKGGYSEAELAEAVLKMTLCLDEIEVGLAMAPWLAGADFSLADIAVLPFATRIRNLVPGLLAGEQRKAIRDWLRRAQARPSFDRAIEFTEDPRAVDLPNI